MREVISNASPRQYLYQIGRLELLPSLYGRIALPQAVAEKLAEGRRRGGAVPDLAQLPWVGVRPVQTTHALALVTDLGAGECEALALALQEPGSLVLLDDALARRYAQHLGLEFTGTLGVLLRAKRTGHVEQIAPILDQLDALRFRLDAPTRLHVLRLAGEA